MKFRFYLVSITLYIFALAACTPNSEDPESGWKTYENNELGISFELPDTWVSQENDAVVTIAVDQEALDNQISTGAGASITLATAKDFDGFSDPEGILGLYRIRASRS
jgi:hypothetical protein